MNDIKSETPCNGTEILMGGENIEEKLNASGIYYLSTNPVPPYAKEISQNFS